MGFKGMHLADGALGAGLPGGLEGRVGFEAALIEGQARAFGIGPRLSDWPFASIEQRDRELSADAGQ